MISTKVGEIAGEVGMTPLALHMATVEKIRNDIAKTKEKIAELQKRLRTLEAQLAEEENLRCVPGYRGP